MNTTLNDLITGAIQLAGDNLTSHGAKLWQSVGGRTCPIGWGGCSQTVFEDLKTGEVDYGEPGGPGHQDCVHYCRHGMNPPPPEDANDEDQPPKGKEEGHRKTGTQQFKLDSGAIYGNGDSGFVVEPK